MKKPPVTSGYREINRPLDFVCLGQMRRGLKRSVPPKLDFVSSQTILFVLTSSETIRNSRNTALLSVFAYISWKRRLKPIFMTTCFFLSRDSITPQKWISSAAWPPASRFIIHSESYPPSSCPGPASARTALPPSGCSSPPAATCGRKAPRRPHGLPAAPGPRQRRPRPGR